MSLDVVKGLFNFFKPKSSFFAGWSNKGFESILVFYYLAEAMNLLADDVASLY